MKKHYWLILLALPLVSPTIARAGLGVGVSTGKIVLSDPLKPGSSSILPTITVINTGDVPARYELGVSHLQDQPELIPQPFWFSYNPPSFELAPNEAQPVTVTMTLPLKVVPGKYFAYVEAHPVLGSTDGTQIGLAAASKLYFNVEASNLIASIYYRSRTIWDQYSPYNYYLLLILLLLLLARYLSNKFHITVSKKSE